MTKGPERPKAPMPSTSGYMRDRGQALGGTESLVKDQVLDSGGSVAFLARDVISRLVARDLPGPASAAVEMADALMSRDSNAGLRLAHDLIASGVSVDRVYLEHLTAAARLIGDRWGKSLATSPQATVATARIYAIVLALGADSVSDAPLEARHAVFATAPGEQHTLGVTMAATLFRRDGWDINLKVGRSYDELLDELARTDYELLAISAASPEVLPELVALIGDLRLSRPDVRIVIGGHLALVEPDLKALTGADEVSSELDTLRVTMRQFPDIMPALPGAARG